MSDPNYPNSVATLTAQQCAMKIRDNLIRLLGPDGANTLGQYLTPIQTTIPSVWIRQTTFTDSNVVLNKMVINSGIEAIIEPEPITDYVPFKASGTVAIKRFSVTLDQWNPTATLSDSLDLIYRSPALRPMEKPMIRARLLLQNQSGEAPARAWFYIPIARYLASFI
jgi:hypothetical protein